MRTQSATHQNRSAALEPFPAPRSPWRVVELAALPDYRLHVTFRDGLQGIVDMSELVRSPGAGVFAALADWEIVAQVRNELGAPTWPGEIYIAPDAIHDAIAESADKTCLLAGSTAPPDCDPPQVSTGPSQ